jgi:recombination protein RecA
MIEKSGAWYSYKDERIGQGKDNVRSFLKEHPEMADEIDQRLRLELMPKPKPKVKAGAPSDSEATDSNPKVEPALVETT